MQISERKEGKIMERNQNSILPLFVTFALMFVMLEAGCVAPITWRDTVVRPAFAKYDKVAIWSRLERGQEELFIPLYMEAFPNQAVVERRDLETIIGEQDILPDRLDGSSRAKIRRILGVKAIVFPNYSGSQLSIKVIDTETGEIVACVLTSHTYFSSDLSDKFLLRQAISALKSKASAISK